MSPSGKVEENEGYGPARPYPSTPNLVRVAPQRIDDLIGGDHLRRAERQHRQDGTNPLTPD